MPNTNFSIGCDPEFFLRDRNTGRLISAIPYVKGTKECPMILPRGGNIQRDNVAVEFATDPAKSKDDFVKNIQATLEEVVKVLPADTEIVAVPSANFDEDQLDHPEALRFGCDPDFDAWEIAENDPPCGIDNTFRSCGAHIHVGTDGNDGNEFLLEFQGKLDTVRVMDCFHGIVSTVLDCSKESIARRQLYGKPGAHRPKEYGVEYRVLSNYWLKSPITVMLMYSMTQDVLDVVRAGKTEEVIEQMGGDEVRRVILTGDSDVASKMIEEKIYPRISEETQFYLNEALAKVRADDMDFHSEWSLYGKEKAA
jgi:hypothetical protein